MAAAPADDASADDVVDDDMMIPLTLNGSSSSIWGGSSESTLANMGPTRDRESRITAPLTAI